MLEFFRYRLRNINLIIVWLFLFSLISPQVTKLEAAVNTSVYQPIYGLPSPKEILKPSASYSFPVLKGLEIDPSDPLKLTFIVDTANQGNIDQEEAYRLINYFLAGLTIPQDDLWVNLSPYESDRIVTQDLAATDLGKDLLGQDYILKQIASSLTYPESDIGKNYWNSLYKETASLAKKTGMTLDSYNKVWIVSETAVVYEHQNKVMVAQASLKAMTERDMLAQSKSKENSFIKTQNGGQNDLGSKVMREIILPKINQEVNQGKNFAQLRQIYYSLVLASLFKKKFQESFYKSYINQKQINGIEISEKDSKEKIYDLYCKAFKDGLYNYIKKETGVAGKVIYRRYFSGGMLISPDTVEIQTPGKTVIDNVPFIGIEKKIMTKGVNPDILTPSLLHQDVALKEMEDRLDPKNSKVGKRQMPGVRGTSPARNLEGDENVRIGSNLNTNDDLEQPKEVDARLYYLLDKYYLESKEGRKKLIVKNLYGKSVDTIGVNLNEYFEIEALNDDNSFREQLQGFHLSSNIVKIGMDFLADYIAKRPDLFINKDGHSIAPGSEYDSRDPVQSEEYTHSIKDGQGSSINFSFKMSSGLVNWEMRSNVGKEFHVIAKGVVDPRKLVERGEVKPDGKVIAKRGDEQKPLAVGKNEASSVVGVTTNPLVDKLGAGLYSLFDKDYIDSESGRQLKYKEINSELHVVELPAQEKMIASDAYFYGVESSLDPKAWVLAKQAFSEQIDALKLSSGAKEALMETFERYQANIFQLYMLRGHYSATSFSESDENRPAIRKKYHGYGNDVSFAIDFNLPGVQFSKDPLSNLTWNLQLEHPGIIVAVGGVITYEKPVARGGKVG
jgi:hypothetical protein